jgi:hypothetical protein
MNILYKKNIKYVRNDKLIFLPSWNQTHNGHGPKMFLAHFQTLVLSLFFPSINAYIKNIFFINIY